MPYRMTDPLVEAPPAPRPSQHQQDVAALALAVDRGYVVLASVRSRAALHWRHACQRNGWPYVKVRTFVTRAAVEVDLEPSGRRLTREAMDRLAEAFRRHRMTGVFGRTSLQTHRAPIVAAEGLAAELWAIATDPEWSR